MKIIVFGGSGFLGSHTADALTAAGHDIVIYDRVPSKYLKKNQKSVVGDVLDKKLVEESIKGCQVAYNFAAIADIDTATNNPLSVIEHNIMGNTIVLEAARKEDIDRFMFASSVYVYSNSGSFYRSSKQACELIIDNYHEMYGMKYTILRYGSLYGPRSDDTNWIYHVLHQALIESKMVRDGDGEELREYIHIRDAARLSVEAMKNEYVNQHVIITGNQQIRIKDLLTMIQEMMGNDIDIQFKPCCSSQHYKITPYTFKPRTARRIVGTDYIDLGQGIYEMLGDIYERNHIFKGESSFGKKDD